MSQQQDSTKAAKSEAGARTVRTVSRVSKQMSAKRLNIIMSKWSQADDAARAQMQASNDPDAVVALMNIEVMKTTLLERAAARLKLLDDKKNKKTEALKLLNAWRQAALSAAACRLTLTAAMLQRPANEHVPMSEIQRRFHSTSHPCGGPDEEFYGLTKDDDPVQLTIGKHVFYAFVSNMPQSDEIPDSQMGWSWRRVLVIRLSACKTMACISPFAADGEARAWGGDWGNRKVIGVPLIDGTPAVWVMPVGYDHDKRLENVAARVAVRAAEAVA